jgi:hypothetical protein
MEVVNFMLWPLYLLDTHSIRGWVGSNIGLNDSGKRKSFGLSAT